MQSASRLLPQTLHLVLLRQSIARSASYECERRGPWMRRAGVMGVQPRHLYRRSHGAGYTGTSQGWL